VPQGCCQLTGWLPELPQVLLLLQGLQHLLLLPLLQPLLTWQQGLQVLTVCACEEAGQEALQHLQLLLARRPSYHPSRLLLRPGCLQPAGPLSWHLLPGLLCQWVAATAPSAVCRRCVTGDQRKALLPCVPLLPPPAAAPPRPEPGWAAGAGCWQEGSPQGVAACGNALRARCRCCCQGRLLVQQLCLNG
jgi:hypothetical protein